MEPFLLKPSCKDSIWGGTKLKKRFHKEHSVDIISESWELSVHPAGLSLAASGPNRSVPLAEFGHLVVRASDGVVAIGFHKFPLPLFGTIYGNRSQQSVVVMDAAAPQFYGFSIDDQVD